MESPIIGARIREQRRQIGLTQAALARDVGISASYLNLIEGNKRRIAGQLLMKIAEALSLRPEDLDGAAERRLSQRLSDIARQPLLQPIDVEAGQTGELIGRFPGWGRAIEALAVSESTAQQTARAMADRLTHDPYLGETVHRMLTRIAAIRSVAEILTDVPDIAPDERSRFNRLIADEAKGLTSLGEALAAYFDTAEEAEHIRTPVDDVESFFARRANHVAEIETALTSAETRSLDDVIRDIITETPELQSEEVTPLATAALQNYAHLAEDLPLAEFQAEAAAHGYDIATLAQVMETTVPRICQRLASLPTEPDRPRFGYVRANPSGAIAQTLRVEGLNVPRYAATSPLWVLYRAREAPGQVHRQHALFADGTRIVFAAFARNTAAPGFGQPPSFVTDMLTMSEDDAAMTVYAPDRTTPLEEVGPAAQLFPGPGLERQVDPPFQV
ncbi:MAG: helix-turn-helix domain-containing protein [Pseudomonadota bacterium]